MFLKLRKPEKHAKVRISEAQGPSNGQVTDK